VTPPAIRVRLALRPVSSRENRAAQWPTKTPLAVRVHWVPARMTVAETARSAGRVVQRPPGRSPARTAASIAARQRGGDQQMRRFRRSGALPRPDARRPARAGG
jgi:hypothetical protein